MPSNNSNRDQSALWWKTSRHAGAFGTFWSEGYAVSTAANGQDALTVLDRIQPDLILSDISMPFMDGIKLLDAVRERPNGGAIPFIFITARGTREDVFAAKAKGVDDYITKPVTRQELLAAVEARLQRTDELMLIQLKIVLRALANAIESRDPYTLNHVEAVNATLKRSPASWAGSRTNWRRSSSPPSCTTSARSAYRRRC
jgi:CheY-like chemotaxis protein